MHFCSPEGRNELDIKKCIRCKNTLKACFYRIWGNNCQTAVVEDTFIITRTGLIAGRINDLVSIAFALDVCGKINGQLSVGVLPPNTVIRAAG